jgi:nucleoid DNA-binding protein
VNNNNNITKNDIVNNLSKKTGFSANLSKKLINDFIEILIQNIRIKSLNIKNIGTFRLINKKERIGRNPHTQKNFVISKRKSLSFIPSKKISNKLNNNK